MLLANISSLQLHNGRHDATGNIHIQQAPLMEEDIHDGFWNFHCFLKHKGPTKNNNPRYKGSKYNLLILCETGEQIWEPLTYFFKSTEAKVYTYAKEL